MRMRHLCLLLTLALAGCVQAVRYPAAKPSSDAPAVPKVNEPLPPHWAWLPPSDDRMFDAPIEFVPSSSPRWAKLPKFWNADPSPETGIGTIWVGLPPLQAVVALGMTEQMQVFRIKVPAGLPDPTPLIPEANAPTYAKWRLGRHLFFAPILHSAGKTYACADCHRPDHGFADDTSLSVNGKVNVPSLINAVYNRHQFWNGRATALEEIVVRSLEDERPAADDPKRQPAEITHIWGGLVTELAAKPGYRTAFEGVFGISQPTQDAIAKALATYMRTLLSGDSLYDRAEARRQADKAPVLTADHVLPLLNDAVLKRLGNGTLSKADAAWQIAHGYKLFHGKAKCAACHPGPLFTDHDFHNIGVYAPDSIPLLDAPTGRITTVPIGLKETRLVGAYKTPTLRNLPRTGPYFHNGKRHTLEAVVKLYDHEIRPSPYLAAALRDPHSGDREQNLHLSAAEMDRLVLFLESLDGTPLDLIVGARPVCGGRGLPLAG
jgi:cytochrome c peroxidase